MSNSMTQGNPLKVMLQFAFPLLIGNLLQQTYNIIDAAIVGQSLGAQALASVGASTSVQFLVLGFCMGSCTGFGIPVAKYFGAGDLKHMKNIIFNGAVLTAVIAVIITVLCTLLCPWILQVLSVQSDIYANAYSYLMIIFLGLPFTLLYNYLSSILRAVGDSRTPFLFLAFSAVLNIFLDLFFILVADWGCAGAAFATIAAQAISGILCLIVIIRRMEVLWLSKENRVVRGDSITELLQMGLPTGLQFSITAIGSMVMQSANNGLGGDYVSGFTAGVKLKQFTLCPFDAIGTAVSVFCSQNLGAGNTARIKKILLTCLGIVTVIGLVLGQGAYLLGRPLLSIYSSDPAVVDFGMIRLSIVSATYFLCGLMDVCCGSIRGLGYSIMPMLVSLTGACAFRVLWIFTVFQVEHTLFSLYISYPISWILTFAVHLLCFAYAYRKMMKSRLDSQPVNA